MFLRWRDRPITFTPSIRKLEVVDKPKSLEERKAWGNLFRKLAKNHNKH